MIRLKKFKKFAVIGTLILVAGLGISQVTAQGENPRVTEACENRNGAIHIIDDGFSRFGRCQGDNRRVVTLGEPAGFVPDKIINVCFNVATAALTVMKGGTCFPHVHWQLGVRCVPAKPCQPDNPDDSFYDPLQ